MLDVAIVVFTPPVVPASMQAARVFRLARLLRLARGFVAVRRLFTPEGVRYAAITTAFLVVIAGAAFAAVEKSTRTTTLGTASTRAISTVTTGGYGDVKPHTDAERVFGLCIMLAGIGFIAIITAAAAERFLTSSREVLREERHLADEVAELRAGSSAWSRDAEPD